MTPDPVTGRWLRGIAIAIFVVLGVVMCTRGDKHAEESGAARIVSIGGSVTEIVFALGEGARVVAVDTSSLYPEAATRLTKIGYQRTLTAEGILALSPTLVIASAEAGPPAAIAQLRAAGVRVEIMPDARTPEAAAHRIEAVGAALQVDRTAQSSGSTVGRVQAPTVEVRAKQLAAEMRSAADAARARCCSGQRTRPSAVLIYARGGGTMMVAGSDTPGQAILELAGARNAAAGFTGYKPLSAEALVESAPEVIVIPTRGLESLGGEAGLLAMPGVAATPAGKARRIVAVDDLLLLGFGPRLGAAIDELSTRMTGASGS